MQMQKEKKKEKEMQKEKKEKKKHKNTYHSTREPPLNIDCNSVQPIRQPSSEMNCLQQPKFSEGYLLQQPTQPLLPSPSTPYLLSYTPENS